MDAPLDDQHIPPIATHDDVDMAPQPLGHFPPASYSPSRSYAGGAYHARPHPSGTTDYRHTTPHVPRRRDPSEEEDIGSSDSSSNSSDYSSDSDASRDELDDDDVPSNPSKSGFGFSAATWASTDPHRFERERPRPRDRPRVIYQDSHYEKKDIHYVMEERHSSRYYPSRHLPPSSFTSRAYAAFPPRRRSVSPFPYRRVSPEPLYKEYREYRDNRHHRQRETALRSHRSSQTSPARVEPIHPTGPRTYVRMLTPTRYRRSLASPISDLERESRWERDHDARDRERKLEREREEREEREREREREKQREIQRAKYQYESRVPPPPPSLSAPLTLRPPPPSRELPLSSSTNMAPPRSNSLSSNAHNAIQYPAADSPPPTNKRSKTSRDVFAPPRVVLPGPGGHKTREEDYDLGEDEVEDNDDDDEYQPVATVSPPPPPPPTPASAPTSRRASSMTTTTTKRPGLLAAPGGSSTSTFALSGGPSAPANNNGTTSTTTTFHVTTPRAISASLAAAQNALSQPGSAAAQAEAEKAEAEKMRIPSFKRGGKTRYQCVYCSKDFSRKNDAYRHMSRKHNDNATEFICVCGRVLSRGDALTRHMRTCRESKEKGGTTQIVLAIAGGTYGSAGAPPPQAKMVSTVPGAAGKRKGGKKRKREASPGAGGIEVEMEGDGEEESIDNDVSMEEED
ncbi:hypothetical protein H2248_002963 [Termitomyces sp. 'cryptogamus']|nr:hypothetical protein H2248_002963 [Termitomyces sp. 'cryptogamus']